MSPTHWILDMTMHRSAALIVHLLLSVSLFPAVATAAEPCRVVVRDEPFHVPEPDLVIAEETWEAGERFRSVMLWKLGKGRVIYIRPGHETFPIYDDAHMLRLIENVVRTSRAAASP